MGGRGGGSGGGGGGGADWSRRATGERAMLSEARNRLTEMAVAHDGASAERAYSTYQRNLASTSTSPSLTARLGRGTTDFSRMSEQAAANVRQNRAATQAAGRRAVSQARSERRRIEGTMERMRGVSDQGERIAIYRSRGH